MFVTHYKTKVNKIATFKGERKSETVKREIFLLAKELVLTNKYTPSIRFWSLSHFR